MSVPLRLGIDLGTSRTVACLTRPDGQLQPLLFDGTPSLPSAVFARPGGGLLVGRDAIHAAGSQPGRFEPSPKRLIDDATVLLGDEYAIEDVLAAVLRRVAVEAHRVAGPSVPHTTLTHPADWGEAQRGRLQEAARRAGLGTAWLVAEPVAAAAFCLRRQPVAGPHLVVFDLVGVAVIRHEPGLGPVPFRVLATAPLRDVSLIRDVVVRAGLTGPPDAVFLIGEPHLAAQVHAALGVAPTVVDQPELAVAAGSLCLPVPVSYTPPPPLRPAHFVPEAAFRAGRVAPVAGVETIALSLPSGEGLTLRGQLRPGHDIVEYIFPEVDGALPLYVDFNALQRDAAANPADPLFATPTWRMTPITDERRFDLAFVPEHLADGPDAWFPEYLTRCRDICAQLGIFFELAPVEELLKEGSLLDTLDSTLRRADGAVLGWKYRRQLARLDTGEVIRRWHTIIEAIDRVVRLTE